MAQITYTIDPEKISEFKTGFLKSQPVPLNKEGSTRMTENEWIKEWGKHQFIKEYQKGKQLLAQEQVDFEKDLIT